MRLISLLCLAALAGGCADKYGNAPMNDDRGAYNAWAIESANDSAVHNAILQQHTLYPYHFVEFSGQLNELGARDAQVLARHYARYPGQVNLRRGTESEEIYRARVAAVSDALAAGGVSRGSIRIADGLPGGEGVGSDRVIKILAKADAASSDASGSNQKMSATTGMSTGTSK